MTDVRHIDTTLHQAEIPNRVYGNNPNAIPPLLELNNIPVDPNNPDRRLGTQVTILSYNMNTLVRYVGTPISEYLNVYFVVRAIKDQPSTPPPSLQDIMTLMIENNVQVNEVNPTAMIRVNSSNMYTILYSKVMLFNSYARANYSEYYQNLQNTFNNVGLQCTYTNSPSTSADSEKPITNAMYLYACCDRQAPGTVNMKMDITFRLNYIDS